MHDHLGHKPAHGLRQFVAVADLAKRQQGGELFEVPAIALDRRRVQRDHVLAFLDGGELSVDLVPLGLEPVHDRRQGRRIDAVLDDGITRPVKLALDLAAALFQLTAGVAGIAGEALAFVVVRLDVFDQIGRPAQLGAEAVERKSLDVVALDAAPVGARPAFFVCRALHPGGALALADRGESAAACCATQKAGQYAPFLVRAACPPADRAGLPPNALAGLGGLPKIVADDPQMRGINDAPLVRRVGARYALAARRVLNHADFVPGDAADIDFVQQHAVTALHVAVDRRAVPARAAGRLHAAAVEICSDVARRFAGDVFREDPAYHVGLGLDDLKLAGLAGNGAVAIGAPAGVAAVSQNALHAAARLDDQIFDVHFAHEGAQRSVELADLSGCGVYRDAEKIEPLARGVPIALIARNAINALGDEHIKGACFGGAHHCLEAGPIGCRCA